MHQPNDVELATMFEVAEGFENGVWWIELAQLSEPDLVPQRKRLRDLCHRAVARRAATKPRFHRSEGPEGHLRAARPPRPCTVDMSGDRLSTMGSAKREKEE